MIHQNNSHFIGLSLIIALAFLIGFLIVPDFLHKASISSAKPSPPTTTSPSPTTPTGSSTTDTPTTTPTTSQPPSDDDVSDDSGNDTGGGDDTASDDVDTDGRGGADDLFEDSDEDDGAILENNDAAGIGGSIESAKADEQALEQQQGPTFCENAFGCTQNILEQICSTCNNKGWSPSVNDSFTIYDLRVAFEPIDNHNGDIVISWRTNKPATSQAAYELASVHNKINIIRKTEQITALNTYHRVIINNQPLSQNYLLQVFSQTRDEQAQSDLQSATAYPSYDTLWNLVVKAITSKI